MNMTELYQRSAVMESIRPSEKFREGRKNTDEARSSFNVKQPSLEEFLAQLKAQVANESGSIRETFVDENGKTQRKFHNIQSLVNGIVDSFEKGELTGDKLVESSKQIKLVLNTLEKSIQSAQASLSERQVKQFSADNIEAGKLLGQKEAELKPIVASFRKLTHENILPLTPKTIQTQTNAAEVMNNVNIANSK
jgi:hypothetical protein